MAKAVDKNGEMLIFADNGWQVGKLGKDGIYRQHVKGTGVSTTYNSRAMDVSIYRLLKTLDCRKWQLEFADKRILSIPFEKMAMVGENHTLSKAIGPQVHIHLGDFDEEQAALQGKMLV